MRKKQDMKKMKDELDSRKKIEDQLRLVNLMAAKLPWITVIIILISFLLIMLELYLKGGVSS